MYTFVSLLAVAALVHGLPQGVTQAIPPPGQTAPEGCIAHHAGSFGMAMVPASQVHRRGALPMPPPIHQISDGQVQGPSVSTTRKTSILTVTSYINPNGSPYKPGQPYSPEHGQAPGAPAPKSPVSPSKPSSSGSKTSSATTTSGASVVSQITDGQIQGPAAGSKASDSKETGSNSAASYTAGSSISSFSPTSSTSAPTPYLTSAVVSQISDGQVQAPYLSLVPVTQKVTNTLVYEPVAVVSDGQVQAATSPSTYISVSDYVVTVPAYASSMVMAARSPAPSYGACKSPSTLEMTLANGILTDSHNRTGYIADNRQFQFDAPPQTGAVITAGWSLCADNKLALGSQKIFYQCRSGNFYNLYDRDWAAQCEAVYFQTYALSEC